MHQAKVCFSERAIQELGALKKTLAIVRMPAAKMEKPGKGNHHRSPAGWDVQNRDLLVNDPEESPDISARWILAEFDRVFSSVTKSDVLCCRGGDAARQIVGVDLYRKSGTPSTCC